MTTERKFIKNKAGLLKLSILSARQSRANVIKITAIFVLLLLALIEKSVIAQNRSTSIAPTIFLSKSPKECEKIFGKVGYTHISPKSNKRNYKVHYFKSSRPGITRIGLWQFSKVGLPGPLEDKISVVEYHFPKGKYTWQQACGLVGVPVDRFKPIYFPGGAVLTAIPPKYCKGGAAWEKATPSADPHEAAVRADVDSLKFGL